MPDSIQSHMVDPAFQAIGSLTQFESSGHKL